FERISWDEALDTITAKLLEVKEKHGARALAVCVGGTILYSAAPGLTLLRRFLDVYGTPHYFSADSMCYRPRMIAYIMTLGWFPSPDPENAKCVIVWANNPHASDPMRARLIERALKKGAKLIVIDPRRTTAAKKADLHLQVRPGTDCALALGMLNVIVSENLYDAEFVNNWTIGFDKLAEHVKPFTPEEVEKITWVPAETIRSAARLYATTRPATILQGTNGLDQTTSGFQSARAVAILQAITGNIDVAGGFVTPSGLRLSPMRLPDMVKEKAIAEERYPLAYEIWGRPIGEGQGMVLYDTLLTGEPYPIKAMIIQGSNPLLSWPNSNKLREALGKLDFLVVMSVFMSETAQLADIVLPAATFMEKDDIIVDIYWMEYGIPYVMLRKKVLQFEEARSDAEFWLELAKRMGYGEYFPWKDAEEFLDYVLEPTGLSTRQLREEMPGGVQYGFIKYDKYKEKGGFRTPSGKVEIYSETMKD
ncbi:molybdopterin-dependent oxidoreductase, partial [Candidatus Aerophobetes bacterium]|nr:molybdopterin-dependent oxidoreductase [Candidatus Aerophobetes bacterium]